MSGKDKKTPTSVTTPQEALDALRVELGERALDAEAGLPNAQAELDRVHGLIGQFQRAADAELAKAAARVRRESLAAAQRVREERQRRHEAYLVLHEEFLRIALKELDPAMKAFVRALKRTVDAGRDVYSAEHAIRGSARRGYYGDGIIGYVLGSKLRAAGLDPAVLDFKLWLKPAYGVNPELKTCIPTRALELESQEEK